MIRFSQPAIPNIEAAAQPPPTELPLLGLVLRQMREGILTIQKRGLLGGLKDVQAIEDFIGKKENCEVKAMVERSFERNQTAAAKKQIVFLVGIPAEIRVRADRRALQKVLDHLVANAIRYSPPNGTVQVHALPLAESVVINIRDQGLGISDAGRQRLFERFSRLMTFQAAGSSSGIALAIVKKLAEALSGSLRWRGDSDSGSTFTLRLPAAVNQALATEFSTIQLLARRVIDFPERN